jgi:hypothetical protein
MQGRVAMSAILVERRAHDLLAAMGDGGSTAGEGDLEAD